MKQNRIGVWIAIGIGVGAGVGVAMHNIPIGAGTSRGPKQG